MNRNHATESSQFGESIDLAVLVAEIMCMRQFRAKAMLGLLCQWFDFTSEACHLTREKRHASKVGMSLRMETKEIMFRALEQLRKRYWRYYEWCPNGLTILSSEPGGSDE